MRIVSARRHICRDEPVGVHFTRSQPLVITAFAVVGVLVPGAQVRLAVHSRRQRNGSGVGARGSRLRLNGSSAEEVESAISPNRKQSKFARDLEARVIRVAGKLALFSIGG